jgi:hypothetical protein
VKAFVNGCARLFVNESERLPINVFVSAFVKETASLFLNGISKHLSNHRHHQAPLKTKGA